MTKERRYGKTDKGLLQILRKRIHAGRYDVLPDEEDFWEMPLESMENSLKKVLYPGLEMNYEYDYGSTTELRIRVQEYRKGGKRDEKITILSRNNPPEILCSYCEKNRADWIDPQEFYREDAFICEECLEKRREESIREAGLEKEDIEEGYWYDESGEFLLPVCNSPRMGVCGYSGSKKYPDQFRPDTDVQRESGTDEEN